MGGMEDPAALTQAITVTWVYHCIQGLLHAFAHVLQFFCRDGIEVETHFHQCHKYEMGNYQVS